MDEVPAQFLDGLAPIEAKKVNEWSTRLPPGTRGALATLSYPRQEGCFFGAVPEGDSASVPVVIGGRFVLNEETAGWAEWHAELFDYLLCNPELSFFAPPVVRTFHICTRHAAARGVLTTGRVP